jgi:signal peptidase II
MCAPAMREPDEGAMRGRAAYLAIVASVVVLDQITKRAVERSIGLHESRPVIDGFLSLTHGRNPGVAFGVLSEGGLPFQAVALTVLGLVAVVALTAYALRVPRIHRLRKAALSLVIGGAIGNLIDRIRYGSVVDFIHVYWGRYQWPDFNVADSAISVGVALMILESLRSTGRGGRPGRPPAASRG